MFKNKFYCRNCRQNSIAINISCTYVHSHLINIIILVLYTFRTNDTDCICINGSSAPFPIFLSGLGTRFSALKEYNYSQTESVASISYPDRECFLINGRPDLTDCKTLGVKVSTLILRVHNLFSVQMCIATPNC